MVSSEYHCMNKIQAVVRDLVPKTIAWGSYANIPDVHFFLADFRPMTNELPDNRSFPAKMAELHRSATSPDGKFGFDVTTFHGETPIEHGWSDTWEDYFARTTKVLFELEQEAQGPNQEIRKLMVPFFSKVVPRLLRPLETGGRSIRPSLIHGDLWHGNASTDSETGRPIIFDAASFYAHNECRYLGRSCMRSVTNDLQMSWRSGGNHGTRSTSLIECSITSTSPSHSQRAITRIAVSFMPRKSASH